MGIEVRVERYGRDVARALNEEIAKAQDGDALAPVTVLVPRATLGLATRRWLASGQLGGASSTGRAGIVNVRFLPIGRFAAGLGEPTMVSSGRLPGGPLVELAAARAVLTSGETQVFGSQTGHPATARVLADVYRDLRPVSPSSRRALAVQGHRSAEVLKLVGAMGELLAQWFDDVDLAEAAVSAIDTDAAAALGSTGHLIAYLLPALPPHHQRLLEAVARHGSLTVLVGTTGVGDADQSARRMVEALGQPWVPDDGTGTNARSREAPVLGTDVLSAPSSDVEVLVVVRRLMERLAVGVPADRMAIAHGGAVRLGKMIGEALSRAGVEHHGSSSRPLSDTVAGRVLTGLFDVVDGGWRRSELMAWLATGPLRFEGRGVPAADWDRVSRRAGVVAGVDEWSERLGSYARHDPVRANGASALALRRFVAATVDRCAPFPATWAGWAEWARALLRDLLGDPASAGTPGTPGTPGIPGAPATQATWPADEIEAFTSVDDLLGQLAVLDEIDGDPDPTTFRSSLAAELERPAPQTTRFGRGVLVASVAELVGIDLDVLFVVGMEDGDFPSRRGEDPLLPDRERAVAGPDVPLRAGHLGDAYRDYLAALLSARERHLSYSRGRQHSRLARRPARWVLDTLAALAGTDERLYAGDVDALEGAPGFEVVPSFTAAVRAGGEPADLADRDLRSLEAWRERAGGLDGHPLAVSDPVLAAGLDAVRHRRASAFSRFEGRLEPLAQAPHSPLNGVPRSPTHLEKYAACPRRYLLEQVLGLDVPVEPESRLRITPQDRGLLIHTVLERWVRAAQVPVSPDDPRSVSPDDPRSVSPDDPRSVSPEQVQASIQTITTVAGEVFDAYERDGRTGRAALWEIDRESILLDLRRFVVEDLRYRSRTGAVPAAVEMSFGVNGDDPVEVEVPARGVVRFRGVIDRVDRLSPPGPPVDSLPDVVVIDYKTGSRPQAHEGGDPVDRGRKLQLPVYALAAKRSFAGNSVAANYWWVASPERFDPSGLEIDDAVLDRLGTVVGTLVEGIESGVFPAHPGPPERKGFQNCLRCPFDMVCPTARDHEWERVRNDPLVVPYAELAEGPGVAPGDRS